MPGVIGIDDDGNVTCPVHPENGVKYMDVGPKTSGNISNRLFCQVCYAYMFSKDMDMTHIKSVRGTADLDRDCIIISKMSAIGRSDFSLGTNVTDFTSYTLEHAIIYPKLMGILPRAVTYIPELHSLATGGENGTVVLWNVLREPKIIVEIEETAQIRCLRSWKNSNGAIYLAVGVQKVIKIYELVGHQAHLRKSIVTSSDVTDIVYGEHDKRLYVACEDAKIFVWNGDNLSYDKVIGTETFGMRAPITTLALLDEDKKLAVEHGAGISVVTLEDQSVKQYTSDQRAGYGMIYLKNNKEFLLRTKNGEHLIIDSETLELKRTIKCDYPLSGALGHQFCANEDDSQVIGNTNKESIFIYKDHEITEVNLKAFIGASTAVVLLHNLNMLAVADYCSGVVLIFKAGNLYKPQPSAVSTGVSEAQQTNATINDPPNLNNLFAKPQQANTSGSSFFGNFFNRNFTQNSPASGTSLFNNLANKGIFSNSLTSGSNIFSNIANKPLFSRPANSNLPQPNLFMNSSNSIPNPLFNNNSPNINFTANTNTNTTIKPFSSSGLFFGPLFSSGSLLFSGSKVSSQGGLSSSNSSLTGSGNLFSGLSNTGSSLFKNPSLFNPAPSNTVSGPSLPRLGKQSGVGRKSSKTNSSSKSKSRSKSKSKPKSKAKRKTTCKSKTVTIPKPTTKAKSKAQPKSTSKSRSRSKSAKGNKESKAKAKTKATKDKTRSTSRSRSKSASKTERQKKAESRSNSRKGSRTKKENCKAAPSKRNSSRSKSPDISSGLHKQTIKIILKRKPLPPGAKVIRTEEDELLEQNLFKKKAAAAASASKRKAQVKQDLKVIMDDINLVYH